MVSNMQWNKYLLFVFTTIVYACNQNQNQFVPPNVILIMTDDQGIGDLSCHGNPWLRTPNIDTFYEEAVRLTDFHVSPLCTPTRSAIITGRYPINNGAWATYKGRDMLAENTYTIADVFKANGYNTAMFGKWHLGDNYPARPTDCGFDYAIHHLAGGIGELSDYWGNSYFDDVFYVNNKPTQFSGYCTDVWFEEATKYINQHDDKPFFIYIPTNAPHDPLIVDEKYAKPYQHLEGVNIEDANLYGMIANIDENFGKFRKYLKDKRLEENTIVIFMTDNGTRFGYNKDKKFGYNKEFEGIKGSNLEGGHRVPFFIRWPAADINGGKDLDHLSAHVDLLPTLASLCRLPLPDSLQFDGMDLSPMLNEHGKIDDRVVFIHHKQDWRPPDPLAKSCVMHQEWRLIDGSHLTNLDNDQKQNNNLANKYPQIFDSLTRLNTAFIAASKRNKAYQNLPVNIVGNPAQEKIKLTVQHAIGEDGGIWKTEHIADGVRSKNNTHAIKIEASGWYEIICRRWPEECSGPIWGIPNKNPKNRFEYKSIHPDKVILKIGHQDFEKRIKANDHEVKFKVQLEPGSTLLSNDFIEDGEKYGVYYTYVKKL